jgi:hypothetical protein
MIRGHRSRLIPVIPAKEPSYPAHAGRVAPTRWRVMTLRARRARTASQTVVILRERGVSSTPRLIDSITGASGILGPRFFAGDDGWSVANTTSRSRGAVRPRFAINLRPENRGRGECRAPDAPAASCALWVASMHTSIHSEPPEITRHSRTQWFTAYIALSPVIGFLVTVICGNLVRPRPVGPTCLPQT